MFHFCLLPCFSPVFSFGRYFSISSFCLTYYVYFCMLGKSAPSLAFNSNNLMKTRFLMSCSTVSVCCSLWSDASESVSCVCCMYSGVDCWLLYSSDHLSAETLTRSTPASTELRSGKMHKSKNVVLAEFVQVF